MGVTGSEWAMYHLNTSEEGVLQSLTKKVRGIYSFLIIFNSLITFVPVFIGVSASAHDGELGRLEKVAERSFGGCHFGW